MKGRKLKKWAAAALSAAMALGMYSVPAFAEGGNTEDLKQLAISGVNYYYADTQGDAADTVYQASVTTGRGASAVTKVYDFSKSDLTQVTGTEYYYTVISGTTPLTGTLYGYKSGTGTATTYQQVYGNLGAHADSSYDVISSATKFSGHHAKDIPSLVTFGKDGSGNKAITGLTLGRTCESVSALDYVEGSILNDAGAALSAQQTEALAVQLKANPMSAPNSSAVTPAVGSASYTTSRYGAGEFVIIPDDTVDGYVWSEYWSNVYAATISNGKNTVGAVHWIDLYGEAAVSGSHYNKIQIAVNNGISPASNEAQVSRYADFFDTDTGALKPGTYTIKVYAEGYDVLTATVVLPEYVLMNIPYSKFYGSEGVENVDVVSSATLKNLNQGLAPGSYHDGYIYTEDEAKGATVQGVTYPVRVSDAAVLGSLKKVSAEDKAEITVATGKTTVGNKEAQGAALLFASGDYAYYVLEEEPGNYKELSGTSKDNFAFSEVKKAAESASGMTVNVGYTGHHTNIEFIVDADGLSDATVTAVTVTADGKKYALRHIEEIWRNVQLGWNWTDIDGAGLGGKTVTNVTYYMRGADGSYRVRSYDVNAYIKPKMAGEQTAAFTNRKNIQITGLADDIAGAKATVKTVVGRGETPTVIAENADVIGGKVALTDAAVFDTNYAVSIVSDNYADISVQAECKDTRADGSVTGTASYEKTVGDEAFVLDAKSDQTLTYTSSDENVVTVDNAGKVSIAGEGSAQITVTAAETDDVKAAELIVTVTVKKAAEPEQPSQPETGKPAEPEQPETEKPDTAAEEKKAADQKAAKEAEKAINALPKTVTEDNAAEVEAARKVYNALTADQKALVSADTVKKLETAEKQVDSAKKAAQKTKTDQKAADSVVSKINALPKTVTQSDKAAVEAARKAYDTLTADQKALVSADAVKKLEEAEKKVSEISKKTDLPKKGEKFVISGNTYAVLSVDDGTAAFVKAKNKKNISVPASVKYKGISLTVSQVNAKAFTGKKIRKVTIGKNIKTIKKNAFKSSKAKKLVVKTQLLTKKSVKGCLKKSKIKTVQVKVGAKKVNKKFKKTYKKFFTKKVAGKKVKVK